MCFVMPLSDAPSPCAAKSEGRERRMQALDSRLALDPAHSLQHFEAKLAARHALVQPAYGWRGCQRGRRRRHVHEF